MKRLYAILLALAMMLSLAACKDSSGSGGPTVPSSDSDLTQAEVDKLLEEMEKEEAGNE